jgi:hypothetical protein
MRGQLAGLRLLGILLFSGLTLLATSQFLEDAKSADVRFLARQLEQGTAISKVMLRQTIAKENTSLDRSSCRSDIQRAILTLNLAQLDQQDQTVDFAAWAEQMANLDRAVRRAAICMPAEGNVWVRMAMASRAIAEQPRAVADLMAVSARLNPAENSALVARYTVWTTVTAKTLAASEETVASDLDTLFAFGGERSVEGLFPRTSDELLPYVIEAFERVPERRRKLINRLLSERLAAGPSI